MRLWDWVGGTQGLGLVHSAHVFSKGVRAGKRAVTFYGVIS